ncbi:hypothetical protein LINPERHAP2_LOCUS20762 [Linum perenne]
MSGLGLLRSLTSSWMKKWSSLN